MDTKELLLGKAKRVVPLELTVRDGDTEVPVTVFIQELSYNDSKQLLKYQQTQDPQALVYTACKCLVDSEGNRLYSDKEMIELERMSLAHLVKISQALGELQKIEPAEKKA